MSKNKKWELTVPTQIWVTITVDAETEGEVMDIADKRASDFTLTSYRGGRMFGIDQLPSDMMICAGESDFDALEVNEVE